MEEKNLNQNKKEKKELTSKAVILIAIGALLVVLIIAGTAAWFTRVSTINQLTMEAANFDFQANYAQEPFIIRAQDYIDIVSGGKDKAAPGTTGVIPVFLSTAESEVAANYTLNISFKSMDEEFRKRIRFFYIKCNDQGQPIGKNGQVTTNYTTNPPVEIEFSANNYISGTLPPGGGHYEYIYWEWVYDLNPNKFFYIDNGSYQDQDQQWLINYAYKNTRFANMYGSTTEEQEQAKLDFDLFDTKVSMGEYDDEYKTYKKEEIPVKRSDGTEEIITVFAYQKAMEVKIDMVGAQAMPTYDATPEELAADREQSGHKFGSAHVDLGELIKVHNKDINTGTKIQ